MVFNATFNKIQVILWLVVLLGGRPEDPDKTITCRKSLTNSLSHIVVHLAQTEIRSHNISGDRH
jgi:hypothetical protein